MNFVNHKLLHQQDLTIFYCTVHQQIPSLKSINKTRSLRRNLPVKSCRNSLLNSCSPVIASIRCNIYCTFIGHHLSTLFSGGLYVNLRMITQSEFAYPWHYIKYNTRQCSQINKQKQYSTLEIENIYHLIKIKFYPQTYILPTTRKLPIVY